MPSDVHTIQSMEIFVHCVNKAHLVFVVVCMEALAITARDAHLAEYIFRRDVINIQYTASFTPNY